MGKRERLSNQSSKVPGAASSSKQKIPEGIEELALRKISQSNNVDLEGIVGEITKELGYTRDRVLSRLMVLESEGKISLVESAPKKSLFSFAKSPESLWFWGAIAATLLSLGLIGVTGGVALYLRYVFGGLLILFLPGYSLLQFLYAKKEELDGLTRLALSIGLSLAIVPLIGLGLNYTPFGIRLIPVALSLALFTIIFLVLALIRKHTYYKIAKDIM